MQAPPLLVQTEIAVPDFLTGARTIPANQANTCLLNSNWTNPTTYLEWARRGVQDDDEHGLANAIKYAKRAACCRIDRLIHNYHLQRLHRESFPTKIKALQKVGIEIPSVIQELIINPRNELEHDYIPADPKTARHALDIATLFLTATDSVDGQESVIVLNSNMLASINGKERVDFRGFSGGAMLFIDIFEEPHTAKIVDGGNREVRYAKLADFKPEEAIELAIILH